MKLIAFSPATDRRKRCRNCLAVLHENPRGAGLVHYGSLSTCRLVSFLRKAARKKEGRK